MIMQKITNAARRFAKKEDGLVAVEWVAMAAAVVIGGVALVWAILGAIDSQAVDTTIAQTIDGVADSNQLPANPFVAAP